MILSDRLPAAGHACSATLIPLLTVIWLLPLHARACESGSLCGNHIDTFFLPLIASSLTEAAAAGAAAPVADISAAALPDKPAINKPAINKPVIIKPPPRPSPPPEPDMPGWRIRVEQQLVTGRLTDGGHAKLYSRTAAADLQKQVGTGVKPSAPQLGLPALLPDPGSPDIWQMDYTLDIPAFAGWPLGTVRQHLAVRLACGACGYEGGATQFVGSAWLELNVDDLAEGWIEDVELVSAGGSKATGELSFFDQQPQQHLLRDDQAQLSLRIDHGRGNSENGIRAGDFTGVLTSWIEGDGRISGAFSGVPLDGTSGIGGVAAQFSGAPCVPLCGVEN